MQLPMRASSAPFATSSRGNAFGGSADARPWRETQPENPIRVAAAPTSPNAAIARGWFTGVTFYAFKCIVTTFALTEETMRKVRVAPKGMGLNEFVAQQEGFFAAEGIEVE